MTCHPLHASASLRAFNPLHFFLLVLCLLGSLVLAPAARAQNYNAVLLCTIAAESAMPAPCAQCTPGKTE